MHAFGLIGHNRALVFRKALLLNLKKHIKEYLTGGGHLAVKCPWSVATETGWSVASETPGQLALKQGGQFRVKRGGQLGVKYSNYV
jgi:hypothetical protein